MFKITIVAIRHMNGGLPKNQISRLQRIQNMAARLVTIRKRSDSISPILKIPPLVASL